MESILADVERLGLEYVKPITYTSDYFPQMLDLAERLIRAGSMYADDTPIEQMRAVGPPKTFPKPRDGLPASELPLP